MSERAVSIPWACVSLYLASIISHNTSPHKSSLRYRDTRMLEFRWEEMFRQLSANGILRFSHICFSHFKECYLTTDINWVLGSTINVTLYTSSVLDMRRTAILLICKENYKRSIFCSHAEQQPPHVIWAWGNFCHVFSAQCNFCHVISMGTNEKHAVQTDALRNTQLKLTLWETRSEHLKCTVTTCFSERLFELRVSQRVSLNFVFLIRTRRFELVITFVMLFELGVIFVTWFELRVIFVMFFLSQCNFCDAIWALGNFCHVIWAWGDICHVI